MSEELPNSLSEQQLIIGGWFVRHKIALAENSKRVLFILTVLLTIYALYGFFDTLLFTGATERQRLEQLTRGLIADQSFRDRNSPQPLSLGEASTFVSVAGKLDFGATVGNPNRRWLAKLDYVFTVEGADTKVRSAVLLPLQTRTLGFYGYETTGTPAIPTFKIISLGWQRIPPHEISNPEAWMAERLALSVEEVSTSSVPVGARRLFRTSFILANNSAYGFWRFPLDVALRRGGELIAIQELTLTQIASGERRPVDLYWFHEVPGNVVVEIKPAINVFDPTIYLR